MAQTKKKSAAKSKTVKKSAPVKAASAKKSAPAKKVLKKAVAMVKKIAAKASGTTSAKSPEKNSSLMKKNSFSAGAVKKAAALIPNSFQPLDDRIIISVEPAAEKTAGGIIIPGNASERPSRGTVLATGPGRRNKKGVVRPLDVNVGDTVIFPQFAGQKIEIGADEFLILREEEVLGIQLA